MKRLSSFVLSLLLLSASVLSVSAAQNSVTVIIDGQIQKFDQPPVIVHDFTLVPLRGILESLGAEVKWDNELQRVTAVKGATTVVLNIGSKTAFVNAKPIQLDIEAQIINGRTMVPLRFVGESLGAKVKWDSTTKRVIIKRADSGTQEFGSGGVKNSSEESTGNQVALTYEQALNMALNHNYDLKNAISDVERSEEVRDYSTEGKMVYNNTELKGLVQANINIEISKKQIEIKKDALSYQVKAAYNDILQKQLEKSFAELSLENAKVKKQVADAKAAIGLMSSSDLVQVENNLKASEESRNASEKALEKAYLKLNQLLGLPLDSKPQLTDVPTFLKLEEIELDAYVQHQIAYSPYVWLADKQVELAELNTNLYAFSGGSEPYEAKKIDLEKAVNSKSSAKEQLDQAIRSLYTSIRQLESQYSGLEANLTKAQETLKKTQIQYDVGMSTAADILEAKVAVESIKQQMFNIIVQLDNMKLAFEKPWVM